MHVQQWFLVLNLVSIQHSDFIGTDVLPQSHAVGNCHKSMSRNVQLSHHEHLTWRAELQEACDQDVYKKRQSTQLVSSGPIFMTKLSMSRFEFPDGYAEYDLHFDLTISPEEVIEGSLRKIWVKFDKAHHLGSNCVLFEFSSNLSSIPLTIYKEVSISYPCLAPDVNEGNLGLRILSMPSLQAIDYRMKWHDIDRKDVWDKLLIGVAAVPGANQIHAVLQPPSAKPRVIIEAVELQLMDSSSLEIVDTKTILPNQTYVMFYDVSRGRYKVTVTPIGPQCQLKLNAASCAPFASDDILIDGAPSPVSKGVQSGSTTNNGTSPNAGVFSNLSTEMKTLMMAIAVVVVLLAGLGVTYFLISVVHKLASKKTPSILFFSIGRSRLETEAAQSLAFALSDHFKVDVNFAQPPHVPNYEKGEHSMNTYNVCQIHSLLPESEPEKRETERTQSIHEIAQASKCDVIALVGFSPTWSTDLFHRVPAISTDVWSSSSIPMHYDPSIHAVPGLSEILRDLPNKYLRKLVVVLFLEESEQLHDTPSTVGKPAFEDTSSFTDDQVTVLLNHLQKKTNKKTTSTCDPSEFLNKHLSLNLTIFYLPHQSQQLSTSLKERIAKISSSHKFPQGSFDSNENWFKSRTVAQCFFRDYRSFGRDFISPTITEEYQTIDGSLLSNSQIDYDSVSYKMLDFNDAGANVCNVLKDKDLETMSQSMHNIQQGGNLYKTDSFSNLTEFMRMYERFVVK